MNFQVVLEGLELALLSGIFIACACRLSLLSHTEHMRSVAVIYLAVGASAVLAAAAVLASSIWPEARNFDAVFLAAGAIVWLKISSKRWRDKAPDAVRVGDGS